jgi:uncharacterized protein YndB with AHSA1/START domain
MAFNLSIELELPATVKTVMHLLTDAGEIRKWSGGEAVLEQKEGGAFSMFDGWVNGRVLKISPEELVYTWMATDWYEYIKESTVSFRLQSLGENALMKLEHKDLPGREEADAHQVGWYDYFLVPLEDYIMVLNR